MDREELKILKTSTSFVHPIFVAFLIRPAREPVYPKTDLRRRTHTASASARRLCPRLFLRLTSLCRAISTLLHLGSVADFSLSATAFTADLIRFAEPLSRRTSSLHCSAAEYLFRRNPNRYGPYNIPYGPYNLSAETLTDTARTTLHTDRTTLHTDRTTSLPVTRSLPHTDRTASSDRAMDPNLERRTKHAYAKRPRSSPTRRPPQPPPQPAPEPYDSDSEQTLSGEHTDRTTCFEERYFTIPTRRLYDNFISMQKKTVENTQRVDLDTLRKLGVEQQFLHLTSRVGISPEFWTRGDNCYEMDTREFLSSLQLK